jgi:dienelactone hydrolase
MKQKLVFRRILTNLGVHPSFRLLLVLSIAYPVFCSSSVLAKNLPKGQIINKVVCIGHTDHSYAVYLPRAYTSSRKWPILFAFDPRARGQLAIEPFREGAEKYGYILVGSNNTQNGPWKPNEEAIHILLNDAALRFMVNRDRFYTAGFSGGGRLAALVALMGFAKGAIVCSGGFPTVETPNKIAFSFFGTAGYDDSNYYEMRRIDEDLNKQGTPHRLIIFQGGHEWPPVAVGTQAIVWLELIAMKTGLRSKDKNLIEDIYQTRLAALPRTIPEVWFETQSLAKDFMGLRDTKTVEQQVTDMVKLPEYKKWQEEEAKEAPKQKQLIRSLLENAASRTEDESTAIVGKWHKEAQAPSDSSARRFHRRLIREATFQLTYQVEDGGMAKKPELRTRLFQVLTALSPQKPSPWLGLARAHMASGNASAALIALRQGVVAGYREREKVESDPLFLPLRPDPSYQKILDDMGPK